MLLLFLGAYGRFSGGLSTDNPYYQRRHRENAASRNDHDYGDEDDRLLAAELAVAAGHATPEQEQLVNEDAQRRVNEAHRRAWELYESRLTSDNGVRRIP
jgi:hypothetical protein